MQTTAADERIFRWKEHRQKLLPKPVVEVLHRKEVDVSPVIQQMSKKIQPSAVKRVSANSTRIMPVMRDTLVFPADMQTAAGRQSAAVLYAAADRGIWAADCRPASERRKGMEQLTDYSINFPHLHIYLHHVGKNIMIGNFSVAYYGIVIAIGMLAGLGIACWMAKRTGQKTDTYFDLALVAIICSVIGARVYYVIFRWDLYKDDLLSVFNLRQGGLAIYGGVIAAIITVFVFSRVRKLSMGLLCDTAGLGLVLGQVIGRWGNFFNREAFGGYTDGLFAMQLPLSAVRSSDVTDSLLQAAITSISHDLRTPLTAICGYLELLEKEPLSAVSRQYVAIIRERTKVMTQLTEELFRYSVVLSVPLAQSLQEVSVNRILEGSIAAMYAVLKRHRITPDITMTDRTWAFIARTLVEQMHGQMNAAYKAGRLVIRMQI